MDDIAPPVSEDTRYQLIVPGNPAPKRRPRCGRHGAHTDARTRAAENTIAWEWKNAYPGHEPLAGMLGVSLLFYENAKHPADVDNMAKLVLDALNGVAWVDDRQIASLHATVYRDHPDPTTRITVEEIGP
jgi:Holliday junction resolvase RusA-like endonuclease